MLLHVTEYRKAVDIVLSAAERFKVREKERVSLKNALGRISAEDVRSPIDVPPFDRATMDGYAVVAADTFYADESSPVELSLIEEVRAGEIPSSFVKSGTCVAVSTGAPMPEGADAVVKVENAEILEECNEQKPQRVRIFKSVAPAENVQLAGSDIKRGERIISEGTLLTPCKTGVLAACGVKEVFVWRKPRVAIISTGDELIPTEVAEERAASVLSGDGAAHAECSVSENCSTGEECSADGERNASEEGNSVLLPRGRIYDVNMQTLCDAVRQCGCVPLPLGIASDDADEVCKKMEAGHNADVIIVSGGTSAGATDVVPAVIRESGELLLHGVDIKPGKPFAFGIFEGKPVFALPGNPTSALLTFSIFVAPFLHRISPSHHTASHGAELGGNAVKANVNTVKARTARRIISEKGRNEFIFVRLRRGNVEESRREGRAERIVEKSAEMKAEKHLIAEPILKGSGAITTLADADGYIFVEKGREIVEEGEEVYVFLLNWSTSLHIASVVRNLASNHH